MGDYDKGINTLDADGVTFAAIQGLVEELKARDKTIEGLKAKNDEMSRGIEAINKRLDSLLPQP